MFMQSARYQRNCIRGRLNGGEGAVLCLSLYSEEAEEEVIQLIDNNGDRKQRHNVEQWRRVSCCAVFSAAGAKQQKLKRHREP